MPDMSNSRKIIEPIVLLLLIVAAVLIGWLWVPDRLHPDQGVTVWIINMLLLMAFAVIAGHVITGVWRGVLIDSRNKISLSRLQMILWTVMILSGFLIAVLINLRRTENPLSITLDKQLWALMGISTTSLVGSPLIKSSKKGEKENRAETNRSKAIMAEHGIETTNVMAQGKILVNATPEDARWTDIFKGEESGNGASLDLAKIQMFFFTLVTWSVYAISLGNHFMNNLGQNQWISSFPDVNGSMVALLGISHAGYLANKAVPHTPDPPPGT